MSFYPQHRRNIVVSCHIVKTSITLNLVGRGGYGYVFTPGIIVLNSSSRSKKTEELYYSDNLVTKFSKDNTTNTNSNLNNIVGQDRILRRLSQTINSSENYQIVYDELFFRTKQFVLSKQMMGKLEFSRTNKHGIRMGNGKAHENGAKVITMEKGEDVKLIFDTRNPLNLERFKSAFLHLFNSCRILADSKIMLFDLKPANCLLTSSYDKMKFIDLNQKFVITTMREYLYFIYRKSLERDYYFNFELNLSIFREINQDETKYVYDEEIGINKNGKEIVKKHFSENTYKGVALSVAKGIYEHVKKNTKMPSTVKKNLIKTIFDNSLQRHSFTSFILEMCNKDRQNIEYSKDENVFFTTLLTLSYIGQLSNFFMYEYRVYRDLHNSNFNFDNICYDFPSLIQLFEISYK